VLFFNKGASEMISANVSACIRGIHLLGDGATKEACDLLKDFTAEELREAAEILEEQALWATKLREIAERHHVQGDVSVHDILTGAADAGDEEAKALIASDLLELQVY
jgi:hypothetical protein